MNLQYCKNRTHQYVVVNFRGYLLRKNFMERMLFWTDGGRRTTICSVTSVNVSSKARYGASSQKVLSQATHYEEVLSTDIKLLVSMLVSRENHLSVHA